MLQGAREGWGTHHPTLPYLREAHKEELMVGEPQGWQALLLPILLQPGLVRLQERRPEDPGRDRQAWGSASPRDGGTHIVGCLEPTVVGDVLAQRLPAIDFLAVDGVAAILLRHARCPVLEGLQGGVLPPWPQVALFVILSPCGTESWDVGHWPAAEPLLQGVLKQGGVLWG